MFASGLLIWNTIRTAMFARRREIEVMKLVGATDWFIRVPFMLEGLIQGLLGGVVGGRCDAVHQLAMDARRRGLPRLVRHDRARRRSTATSGRSRSVILAFGALVGMIGSGIAASRFLDV